MVGNRYIAKVDGNVVVIEVTNQFYEDNTIIEYTCIGWDSYRDGITAVQRSYVCYKSEFIKMLEDGHYEECSEAERDDVITKASDIAHAIKQLKQRFGIKL